MKVSLYFIAFCAGLFTLQAQTVTPESLQGRWKLSTYSANGYNVDFINRTYTVSEQVKQEQDAARIKEMEYDIQIMIEMGQGMVLEFKDSTLIRMQQAESEFITDERPFEIKDDRMILPAQESRSLTEQSADILLQGDSIVLVDDGIETTYRKIK